MRAFRYRLLIDPPSRVDASARRTLNQEVTFAVSLFDLFTYSIPGALYLGFFGYLAARLHWIDVDMAARTPTTVLIGAIIVLSYLLGYLGYPVGAMTNRLVPRRRVRRPRQEFLERVPAARGRAYVQADSFLLLSALLHYDKDLAVESMRYRAAGLMLRNSAPPLALGFVASIVELFLDRDPVPAAVCAVLLVTGFFGLAVQGRRVGYWASLKTLELCFWLPDIDNWFGTVENDTKDTPRTPRRST